MAEDTPVRDEIPLGPEPPATTPPPADREPVHYVPTGSADYPVQWKLGLALLAGTLAGAGCLLLSFLSLAGSPGVLVAFVLMAVLHQLGVRWVSKWTGWSVLFAATTLAGAFLLFGLFLVLLGAPPFLLVFAVGLVLLPSAGKRLVRWFWAWRDIRNLRTRNRQRRENAPSTLEDRPEHAA